MFTSPELQIINFLRNTRGSDGNPAYPLPQGTELLRSVRKLIYKGILRKIRTTNHKIAVGELRLTDLGNFYPM
ncbi:hypothetical protein [Sphingobacterium suaedae]|uniref:Uncharacterized protein n=1 Tax=Sphingobacterium suaedae TaxID=1686402 RepID=A0ABW5KGG8_9SPHI